MKKTRNALEILKRRTEKNPRRKALVEEEWVNYQAALTIRNVRKRAGLTQARLAKEIGTTQSVIARLEDANYRGHTLKILEHIAEALGCRVEIRFRPMKPGIFRLFFLPPGWITKAGSKPTRPKRTFIS